MWDVCLCLDQGYREQYCYLLLLLYWHKKYNRSTTKLNLRKKKSTDCRRSHFAHVKNKTENTVRNVSAESQTRLPSFCTHPSLLKYVMLIN